VLHVPGPRDYLADDKDYHAANDKDYHAADDKEYHAAADMSTSGASTTEFLYNLATEQLTEMQLGFVLAIRGLPAGNGDGQVRGEELRRRVVDM